MPASKPSPIRYDATAATLLWQIRYAAERLSELLADGGDATLSRTAEHEVADLTGALAAAMRALAVQDPDHACTAPGFHLLVHEASTGQSSPTPAGLECALLGGITAWSHETLAALPRPPRRC